MCGWGMCVWVCVLSESYFCPQQQMHVFMTTDEKNPLFYSFSRCSNFDWFYLVPFWDRCLLMDFLRVFSLFELAQGRGASLSNTEV